MSHMRKGGAPVPSGAREMRIRLGLGLRERLEREAAAAGETLSGAARRRLALPIEIDPATLEASLGGVPLGRADAAAGARGGGPARLDVRLGPELDAAVRERAGRAGLAPSAYARAVLGLPVALPGAPVRGGVEVACLSDAGLRELAEQVRRIGVNYNQSVRALNTLARSFGAEPPEGGDELDPVRDMLGEAAELNDEVGKGLAGIEAAFDRVAARARALAAGGAIELGKHSSGR